MFNCQRWQWFIYFLSPYQDHPRNPQSLLSSEQLEFFSLKAIITELKIYPSTSQTTLQFLISGLWGTQTWPAAGEGLTTVALRKQL
jgi:hypothetical protein